MPLKIGVIPIAKKGKFSQPRRREEAELEEAFRQVTDAANGVRPEPQNNYRYDDTNGGEYDYGSSSGNGSRKKVLIAVISVVVVLALALGGGIWYFMDMTEDDGRIYDNVYAAGLNIGGMTPEEAKSALHAATDNTYTQQSLTITLPDQQLVLTPADTGASLDVEAMVDAAYDYGRSGNRWENFQARTKAATGKYELDILEYLTLNTDYIRQAVDQLGASVESKLTQATVTVDGEVPNLELTIEEANEATDVEHMALTILMGTPERSLDTDSLYSTILEAYTSNDFSEITAEYHLIEPDAIDLQALREQYAVEPIDAVLDEETYGVTPEVLGYDFDLNEAQALIDQAQYGQEISIPFHYVEASVTMMSLEEYLFQDELASYASNHVYNPNRTRNLELACEAIDGTIIRPGQVFSFNEIVGQRTAEKGYKAAAVYSGGATVDEVGGGVCQVASTIYYVAMMADMEIVEREEHMYIVTYVPRGMDATIYWGTYDFKFRNNTDYPIRIDAATYDGQVHIAIYGTDDKDYYVEMTYETVSGPTGGGTETKKISADNNPNGYYDGQVIQTAYSGYTIKTYRNKYDKATDKLISSELEATSVFKSRNQIVVELVKEETEPSETTTPTTAPTEAPTTAPPSTEPPTTPSTEPSTEAPTEPPTEAPTEAPSSENSEP